MATVTQSIGTNSRDHSTITLWEADLDDDPTYDSGDDAIGECFADSDFSQIVTIDGGGTIGLASILLTAPSAERHDGTAGTGVRFLKDSSTEDLDINIAIANVEWIEYDGNGVSASVQLCRVGKGHLRRCILHDNDGAGGSEDVLLVGGNAHSTNCILYDSPNSGINQNTGAGGTSYVRNITAHNCGSWGVEGADTINNFVQNVICTDSGTADFEHDAPSNATYDHNLASDTSASGTGSIDSATTADQYVSTTGGSEDLHLKSGADAIDAGTDLGTTPSGVEIDIDGTDRDATGAIWDMGSHEFLATGLAPPEIITLLNRDKISPIRQM